MHTLAEIAPCEVNLREADSPRKQSRVPPSPLPRIPVIVGPTAGGKSALALELANKIGNAELITADAFQIYKGMDIGTAKPTIAERQAIPHHLLDLRDPRDPTPFTVHDWLREANAAITDIQSRGKTPIIVGGTHLYIQNFLSGMFQGPGADESLRAEFRARGLESLRQELERVDPEAAQRIHPNDERRTIRALEVFRLTGIPISTHQTQWGSQSRTDCVLAILDWPTEQINRRINARVKQMMANGFLEEVRKLRDDQAFEHGANMQAREALGYKQLLAHLEGRMPLEDAVEQIKIDTRHFAKAQRTWLRRLRITSGCVVIDAEARPATEWAELVVHACRSHGPTPPLKIEKTEITDLQHNDSMLPTRPASSFDTLAPRRADAKFRFIMIALCVLSLLLTPIGVFAGLMQHWAFAATAAGIGMSALIAACCFAAFAYRGTGALAHAELRRRNHRACPQCAYALDALPHSGACPECGRLYTLESLREDWEQIIRNENEP